MAAGYNTRRGAKAPSKEGKKQDNNGSGGKAAELPVWQPDSKVVDTDDEQDGEDVMFLEPGEGVPGKEPTKVIRQPGTLATGLRRARRHFPALADQEVFLTTDVFRGWGMDAVEVTETAWKSFFKYYGRGKEETLLVNGRPRPTLPPSYFRFITDEDFVIFTRQEPGGWPAKKSVSKLVGQPDSLAQAIAMAAAEFPALAEQGALFLTTDAFTRGAKVKVTDSAWKLVLQRSTSTSIFFVNVRPAAVAAKSSIPARKPAAAPAARASHKDTTAPASKRSGKRVVSEDGSSSEAEVLGHKKIRTAAPRIPADSTFSWPGWTGAASYASDAVSPDDMITIVIVDQQGAERAYKLKLGTRLTKAMDRYAEDTGICPSDLYFKFDGERMPIDATPSSLDMESGDRIEVFLTQYGGKPVIYAFAPRGTTLPSVDIKVSLVPSWEFSAIYPLAPIETGKAGRTSSSWTVSATENSTLVDQRSGRTVASLFWEAHTTGVRSLPPSPPLLPSDALPPAAAFDPSYAVVDATNSILLPWELFEPYFAAVLEELTLHVAARTEMTTYWLPSLLAIAKAGKDIAMRFLPQEEYGQAATLDVSPEPDVVTRVFMLFRGVEKNEAGWEAARERVNEVKWSEVVGLRTEDALDCSKFRVLEWGGMEVMNV